MDAISGLSIQLLTPSNPENFTKFLPKEIIIEIFLSLSSLDLAKAGQVCKSWNQIFNIDFKVQKNLGWLLQPELFPSSTYLFNKATTYSLIQLKNSQCAVATEGGIFQCDSQTPEKIVFPTSKKLCFLDTQTKIVKDKTIDMPGFSDLIFVSDTQKGLYMSTPSLSLSPLCFFNSSGELLFKLNKTEDPKISKLTVISTQFHKDSLVVTFSGEREICKAGMCDCNETFKSFCELNSQEEALEGVDREINFIHVYSLETKKIIKTLHSNAPIDATTINETEITFAWKTEEKSGICIIDLKNDKERQIIDTSDYIRSSESTTSDVYAITTNKKRVFTAVATKDLDDETYSFEICAWEKETGKRSVHADLSVGNDYCGISFEGERAIVYDSNQILILDLNTMEKIVSFAKEETYQPRYSNLFPLAYGLTGRSGNALTVWGPSFAREQTSSVEQQKFPKPKT